MDVSASKNSTSNSVATDGAKFRIKDVPSAYRRSICSVLKNLPVCPKVNTKQATMTVSFDDTIVESTVLHKTNDLIAFRNRPDILGKPAVFNSYFCPESGSSAVGHSMLTYAPDGHDDHEVTENEEKGYYIEIWPTEQVCSGDPSSLSLSTEQTQGGIQQMKARVTHCSIKEVRNLVDESTTFELKDRLGSKPPWVLKSPHSVQYVTAEGASGFTLRMWADHQPQWPYDDWEATDYQRLFEGFRRVPTEYM